MLRWEVVFTVEVVIWKLTSCAPWIAVIAVSRALDGMRHGIFLSIVVCFFLLFFFLTRLLFDLDHFLVFFLLIMTNLKVPEILPYTHKKYLGRTRHVSRLLIFHNMYTNNCKIFKLVLLARNHNSSGIHAVDCLQVHQNMSHYNQFTHLTLWLLKC